MLKDRAMPNLFFTLTKPRPLRRFTQIDDSHCGPAVVQMLLANLGLEVSQRQVAAAGGVVHTIDVHGTRVDQLARAVQRLAPQTQFWSKANANLDDIILVVNQYRYPVAVEWQGVFDTPENELKAYANNEADYGHYSIISSVDEEKHQIIITDPYKEFISQDRIFSYSEFLPRWWDTNEVRHPASRKPIIVKDTRMMFIITPVHATFPTILGMTKGSPYRY